MSYALDGAKFSYMHYEICYVSVAVLHVQMLKRAAAPFILSSFCLLMAIQLVT